MIEWFFKYLKFDVDCGMPSKHLDTKPVLKGNGLTSEPHTSHTLTFDKVIYVE